MTTQIVHCQVTKQPPKAQTPTAADREQGSGPVTSALPRWWSSPVSSYATLSSRVSDSRAAEPGQARRLTRSEILRTPPNRCHVQDYRHSPLTSDVNNKTAKERGQGLVAGRRSAREVGWVPPYSGRVI